MYKRQVQLLAKVFVLVLGGGGVHLVFHLEHYGNELYSVVGGFAVYEVAFAAGPGVVVLFKISVLKSGGPQFVEFGLTVLLKACLLYTSRCV